MQPLVAGREYDDALEPYAAVARHAHDSRPWVLANMVCGIDGSTAVAGRVGPLSSPADAALVTEALKLPGPTCVGSNCTKVQFLKQFSYMSGM